jgi:hypothetical protein
MVILGCYCATALAVDKGEIYSGETKSGAITAEGQTDSFRFYGQACQGVVIEMATEKLDPVIGLYRPDGTLEIEKRSVFSPVRVKDHILEQTGIYTIVTAGVRTDPTGSYNLSLILIPATPLAGIQSPSPQNGAGLDVLDGSFSWAHLPGATGYDLFFSKRVIKPLEKIGESLPAPSMAFPPLESGKTYYWQVVAHAGEGDIQGPVWWFSTCGKDIPKGIPPGLLLLLLD